MLPRLPTHDRQTGLAGQMTYEIKIYFLRNVSGRHQAKHRIDNQDKDSQQWVAFYKTMSMIFFDSYRKSICFYNKLQWINDKYTYMLPFQNKQFQLLQLSTCGAWCLLFLHGMSSKNSTYSKNYHTTDK